MIMIKHFLCEFTCKLNFSNTNFQRCLFIYAFIGQKKKHPLDIIQIPPALSSIETLLPKKFYQPRPHFSLSTIFLLLRYFSY